ncbi:MAG: hypothetical protein JKX74_07680, partial [Flavobacteriales bacterium]|nr:hypothetical protein [Flavobacteriales bacterium]
MKRLSVILFLAQVLLCIPVLAQFHPSIHQEQSQFYSQYNFPNEADYDTLTPAVPQMKKAGNLKSQACSLEYAVYGWHPYWVGTAYNNYDFSLLSTFSYFSYELVPSTGSYSSIHSWKTTPSIALAQAAGTRVELCVTNFGSTNNTTFLSSTTAQQTFIDTIISLLNYRNADGVNIDFEGIPGSMKNNLTTFMTNLSTQLKAAIPGATVTMAVFSVDWSNVFDIPALDPVVDQFIIMGYGYYYSGSSKAGPTAEFYKGTIWSSYNLVRSVNYYLNEGITPSKLVLGLPYYGYEWKTVDNTVPSNTVNSISSRTYAYVQNNYIGTYPRNWDPEGFNPYFIYQSGPDWRQAWVDDEISLGHRYDMVKQKDIGGIGIWALGYDNGYTELWDLLYEKFTNCGTVACSDTIYDTGGPFGDHYDKEDYNFTISPSNSSAVSLTFSSFDLEVGFDSLWIYDGNSIASPLIGGYSGTGSPGTVTSTGNALTVQFYSDVATIKPGWEAVWDCITDSIPPTTSISNPNTWETADFTAVFTDSDQGGSGLNERFYQVSEFNGTEWRANDGNGFFNDNFDNTIHSDWTNNSGVWNIVTSSLEQSDEGNTNTNIYASLAQTGSQSYLYHWTARMQSGTSSNKRQGIHFFCDDATQTNRGNSYFVFFREEDNECQIYKVVNNVWTLMQSAPVDIQPDITYDYKVTFNPISGVIKSYISDQLVASWTDPSPHTSGLYVSLRTGNSNTQFDDLKVYKGRTSVATIGVGPTAFDDIRYQNPDPNTPSGRIVSLVNDSADNWSIQDLVDINVDWTPSSTAVVFDGTTADVDTTCDLTELSANWSTSVDSNSGVSTYFYSIGTSPGDTDLIGWVNNGNTTGITHTGLTLQNGTQYYVNVLVLNGAGLLTNSFSSDGQAPVIPGAAFTSDVTALTLPDSIVNFADSSSGADSWVWVFPGGDPLNSTLQNPVVSYNTSGSYDVTLIASNSFGCNSVQNLTSYIVISDPVGSAPIAAFTSDVISGCAPLTVGFIDASANNPDSLYWTFNGGNITNSTDSTPGVIFSQAGTYEVTLQAYNQFGEDSISINSFITVYPIPTALIAGDSN